MESVLIVEDFAMKSFCSDSCIVQFHAPLITHYEKEEKEIRKKHNTTRESCFVNKENPHYIQKTLENPKEIWEDINELGEKLYVLFARHEDKDFPFTMIVVTYLYQKVPSFVFFQTATNSEVIMEEYRRGTKIEDVKGFLQKDPGEEGEQETKSGNEVQVELPQEEVDSLERKKSALLAELLTRRTNADIPFENFYLYDPYIPSTIESPDEIFSYEDDEGDELFVYLKGHSQAGVSFYYIVICTKLEMNQKENSHEEVLFPILSFPTLDGKLTKLYCVGEKISGNLKN